MKIIYPLLLSLFNILVSPVLAQNLPSLLTGRNINSTFSIIAYDPQAKEWGIAVATNNIYVGNSTSYIRPGKGAFSVIAETDPVYALNGFAQLKSGSSIQQAIEYTTSSDSLSDYRQVAGIDSSGQVYAVTGSSLHSWKGHSAHQIGKHFAVMGNQLKVGTLEAMSSAFSSAKGTLASRLMQALIAGEHAGGQLNGKQSAALLVKGTQNEWYNDIDLRVDHSKDPFTDLLRLLEYHYGRTRLNQAVYALHKGTTQRGETLLKEAFKLTSGWYGIYSKLAKAYLLAGQEQQAIKLILTAVKAEPKWRENVPAFYSLYHHKKIRRLYPEAKFELKDWTAALSMMLSLGEVNQATELSAKVIAKYSNSSYGWYFRALALQRSGDETAALQACNKAVELDPGNRDAARLISDWKGKKE